MAAVVGILSLTVAVLAWPPAQPIYKGRPIKYWLQPTAEQWPEAESAVTNLGARTLPFLLNELQYQESPFAAVLKRVGRKVPFLHVAPPPPVPEWPNEAAAWGFRWLGSNAVSAVPELIQMYDSHPNAPWSPFVPISLGYIGPPAKQAVPMLLRAITNTNDLVRLYAARALGQINADSPEAVPALAHCLRDPREDVQMSALWALHEFGAQGRSAVPELLRLAREEKPGAKPLTIGRFTHLSVFTINIYTAAKTTVWKIAPDLASNAGIDESFHWADPPASQH